MLQARGVTKRYPGVVALRNVDIEFYAGEIHGLIGQNGAGKSTLLKILTGAETPDAGTITVDGRAFAPRSPHDAQRAGVGCVYQEVNLVPTLSVAENLLFGNLPRSLWGIHWRRAAQQARDALAPFDMNIDVTAALASYSVAVQQIISIARAVERSAKVLILDEPTSSLDAPECETLFKVMSRMRERGLAIIFVTHFLHQVFQVCDRVTSLRNGERVATRDIAECDRGALVTDMLGRPVETIESPSASAATTPRPSHVAESESAPALLTARGLERRGAIYAFDLEIHNGEIVGFAGLLGAGRTEAARLLFAADRATNGSLAIQGCNAHPRTPRETIAARVGFCPEERKRDGAFLDMSVANNITLVAQRWLSAAGLRSRRAHAALAKALAPQVGLKIETLRRPLGTLSGGNQQKALLARWLAARPRLLILDEPTRGIDIAAKAEIERLVRNMAADGLAVIFISAELDEVARSAQRVLVFHERRVVAELRGPDASEARILNVMANAE